MTLIIQKPTGAKLVLAKDFSFDADAAAYIAAVEAADTQSLETNTRYAINNFVIGCKQDGIWSAIKASCILAGARTLAGALVPLVGTAPTNVGGLFVSGDYNRKTGLVGNGSTKYLLANRNENSDPQNDRHFSCYASSFATGFAQTFMAARTSGSLGLAYMDYNESSVRVQNNSTLRTFSSTATSGFTGTTRPSSATVDFRILSGGTATFNESSLSPGSAPFTVFARDSGVSGFSTHRLAFYSIGESLDLALLDARVTDLINAFAAAIP
jgi:hypothetical protein